MAQPKKHQSEQRPPDTDARDNGTARDDDTARDRDSDAPRRGKPKPVDEMPRPVRGRPDLVPGPGGESRPIGPDLGSDTDGDLRPPRLPGNKF